MLWAGVRLPIDSGAEGGHAAQSPRIALTKSCTLSGLQTAETYFPPFQRPRSQTRVSTGLALSGAPEGELVSNCL